MTAQITGRTATGRRTIWRWAADTAWAHASTGRTLPIRPATVRIRSKTDLTALKANPNIHRIGRPRTATDPATGRPAHYITVHYADTAHPIRNPRLAKAHRIAKRAAARLAWAAGTAGAVLAAGALVNHLWGDEIAAAIRLILTAGLTLAVLLAAVLLARSISVGHPCPGLHCPNCGGGH